MKSTSGIGEESRHFAMGAVSQIRYGSRRNERVPSEHSIERMDNGYGFRDTSHHRMGYFITPKGIAKKNRLLVKTVAYNVRHYSQLKSLMIDLLLDLQREKIQRLVFMGSARRWR